MRFSRAAWGDEVGDYLCAEAKLLSDGIELLRVEGSDVWLSGGADGGVELDLVGVNQFYGAFDCSNFPV